MDILTLSTTAVRYLVSQIKNTKGTKEASDEISSAIWQWVRPIFLKDDTPIKDLNDNPDSEINQQDVKIKISKYLSNNSDEIARLIKILDSNKDQPQIKGNKIDLSKSKIKAKGNVTIVGGNQIKTTNND